MKIWIFQSILQAKIVCCCLKNLATLVDFMLAVEDNECCDVRQCPYVLQMFFVGRK
jgi:hypothetical protein